MSRAGFATNWMRVGFAGCSARYATAQYSEQQQVWCRWDVTADVDWRWTVGLGNDAASKELRVCDQRVRNCCSSCCWQCCWQPEVWLAHSAESVKCCHCEDNIKFQHYSLGTSYQVTHMDLSCSFKCTFWVYMKLCHIGFCSFKEWLWLTC